MAYGFVVAVRDGFAATGMELPAEPLSATPPEQAADEVRARAASTAGIAARLATAAEHVMYFQCAANELHGEGWPARPPSVQVFTSRSGSGQRQMRVRQRTRANRRPVGTSQGDPTAVLGHCLSPASRASHHPPLGLHVDRQLDAVIDDVEHLEASRAELQRSTTRASCFSDL